MGWLVCLGGPATEWVEEGSHEWGFPSNYIRGDDYSIGKFSLFHVLNMFRCCGISLPVNQESVYQGLHTGQPNNHEQGMQKGAQGW